MVFTALFFLTSAIALANTPPVAEAGPSQTIFLGDSVTLHGSATDPDGDPIMSWQWEVFAFPGGSTYSLAYPDTADARFTTDTVGNYVLTLIVFDGLVWSDPDATVVSVVENQPPTAVISVSPVAGPAPLVVNFDGSGSFDPEGGTLLYDWIFDDGDLGTGPTSTHEYQNPGIYVVRLRVTDDHDNINSDTIEIRVTDTPPPDTYSCVGFEPPLSTESVEVKNNKRVLPFKAMLVDENGNPVTDIMPPKLECVDIGSVGGTGGDPVADLLPAGKGTDGNQFELTGDMWHFNMKLWNFGPSTYRCYMIPGTGYEIDPSCTVDIEVKD